MNPEKQDGILIDTDGVCQRIDKNILGLNACM
jgi:hypothetical protein